MKQGKALKTKIGLFFLRHFVLTRSLIYFAILTGFVGLASIVLYFVKFYWILFLYPVFVFFCIYQIDKILTPIIKMKPYKGKHREQLFAFAQKNGVELKQLYVKESKYMNAVALGLWNNKSVLLLSHLVEHYPYDEIEAIMAHEVGHLGKGITTQAVGITVLGILCSIINVYLVHEFLHNQWIYLLMLSAVEVFLFLPFGLLYRRKNEHYADVFALQVIKDKKAFARAFKRSTKEFEDQGIIISDNPSFFDKIYFDHPLTIDRINLALR